MDRIAAGIVLYNPDMNRLDKCIKSILAQVDFLIMFDNSTEDLDSSFLERFDKEKFVYITKHKNKGIAYALNQIMSKAKNQGYDWVITLDQDSIMQPQIVKDYRKCIESRETELGIVCPQVIDKRRKYMEIKKEPAYEFIEDTITSASCTNIRAWENIGGFDEWLFIDLVDNEFCKRLVVSGYKIMRINKCILDQEFGKISPKKESIQNFYIKLSKILHNDNIAKLSYKKVVDPMRVYYTSRNIIYVNKKMKRYGKVGFQNYNCKGYVGFMMSFLAPSIVRGGDKIKILKAIVKGTVDGIKRKTKPWKASYCINGNKKNSVIEN